MWQEERLLYLREHKANCYSAGPYLFAKVVFNVIPVQCMSTTTFAAIAYFWVGFNPNVSRFTGFLVVLLLSNVVANSLMIMIGTLTRSPARRSSAEHLIATKALRCTATARMLIAAERFAKF